MSNVPSAQELSPTDRQFWAAVQGGEAETVRSMLASDASLAAKNYDPVGGDEDFYPLAPASSRGDYDIVELLLDHGADIDKPDQHGGYCAIQRAVEGGHFAVAHLLLDHGAAVDAYPDANQPLMERLHNAAVADGVPDSLIRHGYRRLLAPDRADADLPDGFDANDSPESVRLLARTLSLGGHCTFAPLIRHGHTDLIEEIFRLRVDAGDKIWSLASWYGYPDVLDLRLRISPDLVLADHSMQAIEAATISHNRDGSYADYRRLIESQLARLSDLGKLAEFHSRFDAIYQVADAYCWHDNYGYRAGVSHAEDACDLAQLFLNYGCDIDRRDAETNLTPLAKAILRGQPVPNWTKFIKFLIDAGADLCQSDPVETNPLNIAQHDSFYDDRTPAERDEVIQLLEIARRRDA